jgi:hypothetical protein
MTRGRPPLAAQEDANPIAEKRGIVMHYRHEPGSLCDFSIMGPDRIGLVRVRRVRRLSCTIEELSRQCAPEIAALRIVVSSPAISREIWLCSPRCAWRFFRVLDASIIELGRDGLPVAPADPVPVTKVASVLT